MPGPIEEAFVDIKARLDPGFEDDVRKGVLDALKRVEAASSSAFKQVSADADRAGDEVARSLDAGVRDAIRDLQALGDAGARATSEIKAEADEAGDAIGEQIGYGADVARNALRDLGAVAATETAEIATQADQAGDAIGTNIRAGAVSAREALRGLGAVAATETAEIGTQADQAGDSIGRNIREGVTGALTSLRSLGSSAAASFAQIRADAAATGAAVDRNISEGSLNALSSLRRLATTGVTVLGTLAAYKTGEFLKDLVVAASDLGETLSKVGVVFGDASGQVERFARGAATNIGQSNTVALEAAATFGIFGKSAGLSGKELGTFSTDLAALASDMASFSNTTPEEAIESLGAALRGESEPIRRYGVLLDDATLKNAALKLGIIETTKDALTPAQKVLAAQAEIFRQTGDAQGDYARTWQGLANQQRELAAQTENLKASFGELLLPAVTDVVQELNTGLLPALNDLTDAFKVDGLDGFVAEFEKITGLDIGPTIETAKEILADLETIVVDGIVPAFQEMGDAFPVSALSLGVDALGFLADNTDLVKAAVILYTSALVAAKVQQIAFAISSNSMVAGLRGVATGATTARVAISQMGGAARSAAGAAGVAALVGGANASEGALGSMAKVGGAALLGFSVAGPYGAAIAGAGTLLYELVTATKTVGDTMQGEAPKIQDFAGSLDQVTAAATEATKKQIFDNLIAEGAIEDAKQFGLTAREMIDIVTGGEGRFNTNIQALKNYADGLKNAEASGRVLTEQEQAAVAAAGNLTSTLGALRFGLTDSREEVLANARAFGDLSELLKGFPPKVISEFDARGVPESLAELKAFTAETKLTPKQVRTLVEVGGIETGVGGIKGLIKELRDAGQLKVKPRVEVDVDTKGTNDTKKVKADVKEIDNLKGVAAVEVQDNATKPLGEITRKIRTITTTTVKAKVGLDTSAANQALQRIRASFQKLSATKVEFRGIKAAARSLSATIGTEANKMAKVLRTRSAGIKIDFTAAKVGVRRDLGAVAKIATTEAQKITKTLTQVTKTAKADLRPFQRSVQTGMNQANNEARSGARKIKESIEKGPKDAEANLSGFSRSLASQLGGIQRTASASGQGIGQALAQGLAQGVTSGSGAVAAAAAAAVRNAVAAARAAGGIASPSKETLYLGEMFSEGLGAGIAKRARMVAQQAADAVKGAVAAAAAASGAGPDFDTAQSTRSATAARRAITRAGAEVGDASEKAVRDAGRQTRDAVRAATKANDRTFSDYANALEKFAISKVGMDGLTGPRFANTADDTYGEYVASLERFRKEWWAKATKTKADIKAASKDTTDAVKKGSRDTTDAVKKATKAAAKAVEAIKFDPQIDLTSALSPYQQYIKSLDQFYKDFLATTKAGQKAIRDAAKKAGDADVEGTRKANRKGARELTKAQAAIKAIKAEPLAFDPQLDIKSKVSPAKQYARDLREFEQAERKRAQVIKAIRERAEKGDRKQSAKALGESIRGTNQAKDRGTTKAVKDAVKDTTKGTKPARGDLDKMTSIRTLTVDVLRVKRIELPKTPRLDADDRISRPDRGGVGGGSGVVAAGVSGGSVTNSSSVVNNRNAAPTTIQQTFVIQGKDPETLAKQIADRMAQWAVR